MKPRRIATGLILLAASAAQLAHGRTPNPEFHVDAKTRDMEGGRSMVLVMETRLLNSSLRSDEYRLAGKGVPVATFSSQGAMDEHYRQVAISESSIEPLRRALADDDFEGKVQRRLTEVLKSSAWLGGGDPLVWRNDHPAIGEYAMNKSATRQILMLRTHSEADYLFRSLELNVTASMLIRREPKDGARDSRSKIDYIPYRVAFIATVKLPAADPKRAEANFGRWSAERAELAHQAMETALDWVAGRLARNLDETETDAAAWSRRGDRPIVLIDGMRTWVVEESDNGRVYFDPDWRGLHYETQVKPRGSQNGS